MSRMRGNVQVRSLRGAGRSNASGLPGQSGDMALRWCAAGLVEAGKQFRRVNGHMHLPTLRAALERHVAMQGVDADRQDETENVA